MTSEHRRFAKADWVDAPSNQSAVSNTLVNGALASLDKKSLLIGGYNPRTGRSLSQALEFDPSSRQWAFLSTSWFPVPLSEACMVAASGSYVVFGGYNGSNVVDDLWVLTPKSEDLLQSSWQLQKKKGPSARRGHSMVVGAVAGDGATTIYVFGGFNGTERLNDLWTLKVSPGGLVGEWLEVAANGAAPSPRDAASLAYDSQSNRLILFGGFATTRKNDLFFFDCAENKWLPQHIPGGPTRRQNAFAVVSQGFFILLMGHDGKAPLTQSCQLSLADLKWSVVNFEGEGELDGRWYGTAGPAEAGKKLIIFGGTNSKAYTNSTLELEFERVEVVAAKGKGK